MIIIPRKYNSLRLKEMICFSGHLQEGENTAIELQRQLHSTLGLINTTCLIYIKKIPIMNQQFPMQKWAKDLNTHVSMIVCI